MPVALLNSDLVILATGFDRSRPGGEWLDQAIGEFALPCHECGYPIVDANLCWHPGLYVAGPLAELELGRSPATSSEAVTPQAGWRRDSP